MTKFKKYDLQSRQPNRVPLRSSKELAEEFGVPTKTLANLLRMKAGPDRILAIKGVSGDSSWYDPEAVRKWWKTLERK